jgi:hypothetical protein
VVKYTEEAFMKANYVKLLWAALVLALLPALVCAQEKYALVIGNAAYTSQTPLRNTLNDADDMKAALEGLGFRTELILDGSLRQMNDGVRNLARKLRQTEKSYGFFYYSGHGLQYNGENYLVPVNADLGSEADLPYEALHAQRVLDQLQESGNILNIVVLDACRDTPYGWARSGTKGLSVVGRQPPGSIVVYATSAGATASDLSADGAGRNGLFTAELLKHLKTPGLEVNEIFRRTGAEVSRASNRRQIPAIYSQFFDTAYMGRPPAGQSAQQPVAPDQAAPYTPSPPEVHTGSVRVSSAVAGSCIRAGEVRDGDREGHEGHARSGAGRAGAGRADGDGGRVDRAVRAGGVCADSGGNLHDGEPRVGSGTLGRRRAAASGNGRRFLYG